MTATITARNVGYEAFTLTGPSDCLLFLEVLDSQGNVVWHSNGTCAGQTVTEALAPGEDKVRSIMWNGSNLAGARLPPGFYHVRGVARVGRALALAPRERAQQHREAAADGARRAETLSPGEFVALARAIEAPGLIRIPMGE